MDDEDGENDSTLTRSPMGGSALRVLVPFARAARILPHALACAFCTEIEPLCSSSPEEDLFIPWEDLIVKKLYVQNM